MRRRPVPVSSPQQTPQSGSTASEAGAVGAGPDVTGQPGKGVAVRYSLNLRFLLISVAMLCGLAAGTYGVHYFQTQRMAVSLLQRARQLLADKQPREALTYLQRYLGFAPHDINARLAFCQTLEQVARTQREQVTLFLALHDLLRRAPEQNAQRRTLCTVALRNVFITLTL